MRGRPYRPPGDTFGNGPCEFEPRLPAETTNQWDGAGVSRPERNMMAP